MKKSIIILSLLSLVIAMTACSVVVETELEQDQAGEVTPHAQDVKLVPMTFTASYSYDGVDEEETKTVLNGFKIEWKAGDKIAVFDNVDSNVAHEFTAESDGETTTFTGSVAAGATKFFAVYPYSAAEDCTVYGAPDGDGYIGNMNVNIPQVQTPVAGSFDPAAAVLVAYTTESADALNFKVPFALVKFTVDYDDVYSVSFSSNEKMTGSLKAFVKTDGSFVTDDGDGLTNSTLSVRNNTTPLTRGETYYAVLRAGYDYTSFTATLGNTDCGYAQRIAKGPIGFTRASVNNLGNFFGLPFITDRYRGYEDGLSLTIGSRVINKSTNGGATLITNSNDSEALDIRGDLDDKTGVFFFNTKGGPFKISGTVSITKPLALLNNSDSPIVFTTSENKAWNFIDGAIMIKGIDFDASGRTSGALFSNTSAATATSDYFVLDDCKILGLTKSFYAPNSATPAPQYPVTNFEVTNCTFGVNVASGNIDLFGLSGCTSPSAITNFSFTHSLVYNSKGATTRVVVLNMPAYTSGSFTTAAVLSDNLFINAVGQSTGSLVLTDAEYLTIENNIWYDGNAHANNCNVFDIKNTSSSISIGNVTLSNNRVIGLSDSNKYTHSNSAIATLLKEALPNKTNLITKDSASDIFDTVPSITDGVVTYALKPAYADRGPQ